MGKNTPNKRKSSTIANATPIKFPKLSGTPVSNKINNKSPKLANKVNQKQINGSKSPNKNQKNGKQITPQGRKKTKQIEEDESDDESDDSMDEQNGNSDNLHDATDEEVDSDEEQVDEADSDEEADVAEEADSDEEADVAEEADSDEEADVAEEADSDEEADVAEEADSDEEADVAEEADSDEEAEIEEGTDNSDEEADSAEVLEEQDEEDEDADAAKNNKVSDFTVFITGLNSNEKQLIKMETIFPDCNIKFVKRLEDEHGSFNGQASVTFQDQESMTKALEKDETKIKDSVIRVKPEFCAHVSGFRSDLSQIFQDCDMLRNKILQKPVKNECTGRGFIYFTDKKSLEKALKKNQIEDNGSKISVELPRNKSLNPDFKLFVQGLTPKERISDIFGDCSLDEVKIIRHPVTHKPTGKAFIFCHDEDSLKKALQKNGRESDGFVLLVEPARIKKPHKENPEFTALIKNLNSNTKLEDVFKDCKIHNYNILRVPKTNKFKGTAFVNFEDEESLQKALLKSETEYDGNVIIVLRYGCTVYVKNLNKDLKVEDVFKDCKIQRIDLKTYDTTTNGSINFKDKESFEKALSKNNTKFEGKKIKVQVFGKKNMNSGHTRSYVEPVRNSNNPGNKVAFLKKKLLVELRAEAAQLEGQIYGNPKPIFHKKKHFLKRKI